MASKTKIEQKRFTGYLEIYVQGTPAIAETLKIQKTAAKNAVKASTNSAKAQKTIETRRDIHGQSTTTSAGAQSIKKAGTERAQQTKT